MTLRYYFDECADEDVATALESLGLDVVTTTGLGRKGDTDQQQLDHAIQEDRVIYTTDVDFLVLARDYQRQGKFFTGIIYHAPGVRTKREIIDSLVLCGTVYEPADMHNHVEFI